MFAPSYPELIVFFLLFHSLYILLSDISILASICWLKAIVSRVWWSAPVISAFGRLNQEDHEFKISLSYIPWPCLKKKKKGSEILYKVGKSLAFRANMGTIHFPFSFLSNNHGVCSLALLHAPHRPKVTMKLKPKPKLPLLSWFTQVFKLLQFDPELSLKGSWAGLDWKPMDFWEVVGCWQLWPNQWINTLMDS
jgi:hypothetical protein